MIREIIDSDFEGLMQLYTQLHQNEYCSRNTAVDSIWQNILKDRNHHIIVAIEDGNIVSSCVCVIICNLTHHQRPYALIENVVTDKEYRNRGLASKCLDYAKQLAVKENCYKMMLLTGTKEKSILDFYQQAGYNQKDKTAFIHWL